VIGKRGKQDAQYDGKRFPVTRGKHQRKQLSFVADFGNGDDQR